ncbi:MAG TPA: hypothetical protein PLF70_00505 [Candidatus Portnoybacteria bacterium]|nr:hypothetical protein [Candidatus Portnoybacteria bacterium]
MSIEQINDSTSKKTEINNEEQLEQLSDDEFIGKYPENGFGWGPVSGDENSSYNKRAELIIKRWEKINESRPKPEIIPMISSRGTSTKEHPYRGFEPLYMRNSDGQIVGKNNEPIRRSSPEWRDAARHNLIPRNQDE